MRYNEIAITVSDLNLYVKNKIATDEYLSSVLIKGEISNFKNHYTGHMYFTLKDEKSLIKCIMFKTYAQRLSFIPKDGMKVVVGGSVSVYERDGVYQIYCEAMLEDGVGDLHAKYEELKNRLEKNGMFDQINKKAIPLAPKVVGVLTSQTGSVIKDIINVATRRNPNVYIRLFPVPVQGDGAAKKIAEAIQLMNEQKLADVLILARGGGSLEDLWPFNEEIVADAIFNSEIPIISAVGHETDFTISDFVSDLRAPTPSAAAELAVPDIYELNQKIEGYRKRYKNALSRKVEIMKLRHEKCMKSAGWKQLNTKINEKYILIDSNIKQIENLIKLKIEKEKSKYSETVGKLDTLSPLKILSRGYAVIQTQDEKSVIRTKKELKPRDLIKIKLSDGSCIAEIKE